MTGPRPTRKEARAKRADLKQIDQEEKKARLLAAPALIKAPRVNVNVDAVYSQNMTWCFSKRDEVGEWSWGTRAWAPPIVELITTRLTLLSASTWAEIDNMRSGGLRLNHPQEVETLCDEAQVRWAEIELPTDTAYRFRLSGTERIWGYRTGGHFHAVWYDEYHLIYPVEKKGT